MCTGSLGGIVNNEDLWSIFRLICIITLNELFGFVRGPLWVLRMTIDSVYLDNPVFLERTHVSYSILPKINKYRFYTLELISQ